MAERQHRLPTRVEEAHAERVEEVVGQYAPSFDPTYSEESTWDDLDAAPAAPVVEVTRADDSYLVAGMVPMVWEVGREPNSSAIAFETETGIHQTQTILLGIHLGAGCK
ncbi:luciferase family oxidoreductase, group 1 [Corchorus olitorius]|uniref:Luciferase family oxidoreductase, group 1 n=1 Tax=Corchorus olitorius TaxID=93759 RepID=A0A1R3JIH5_9ROSI|nr:luciferase family oxidoreductase, group 1 [Corchorus olitorius]